MWVYLVSGVLKDMFCDTNSTYLKKNNTFLMELYTFNKYNRKQQHEFCKVQLYSYLTKYVL